MFSFPDPITCSLLEKLWLSSLSVYFWNHLCEVLGLRRLVRRRLYLRKLGH